MIGVVIEDFWLIRTGPVLGFQSFKLGILENISNDCIF